MTQRLCASISARRFELPTSRRSGGSNENHRRSVTKKSPRQAGIFLVIGAPGRIRTADHLVRSQVLYPAELRARWEPRILGAGEGFVQKSALGLQVQCRVEASY
jgi:hypothetical protein